MHLNGENKLNVIKWMVTRDEHAKVLKIYHLGTKCFHKHIMFMKTFSPQEFVCSCPGAISLGLPGILQNADKKGVGLVNRP